MCAVVYRKYRPSSFEELVGLDQVKQVLIEQIKNQKISHAYLFSGPRGTGKTSVARILAREVNKECGVNYQEMNIIEIDAASNRGIDEIRQLKENINFLPVHANYKIYIIDEVHMLTKEAFNALLKTLEEPPEHIIFILATTEPEKVPVTVLSRVMRFDFRLGSNKEIFEKLNYIAKSENIKIDDEAIEIIIEHAQGSFRDAESVFDKVISSYKDQEISTEDVEGVLGLVDADMIKEFVVALCDCESKKAHTLLENIYSQGKNLSLFRTQVINYVRGLIINEEKGAMFSSLLRILKAFQKIYVIAKYCDIALLPYEIAVFELCNENINSWQSVDVSDKKVEKSRSKIEKEYTQRVEKEDSVSVDSEVSFSSIENKWQLFLDKLQEHNHHLTAFFSKASLCSYENNILKFTVPYKFHKKKLEDASCRKIVELVTKSIWNIALKYQIDVDNKTSTDYSVGIGEEGNHDLVENLFGI
jgi:DNA polymerase III subunit gamma/tau